MQDDRTQVTVYGADWCGPTKATRGYLDERGVPYTYVNVDEDRRAAEWVKSRNDGQELKPTLDIGGEVLGAPSRDALDAALDRHGMHP